MRAARFLSCSLVLAAVAACAPPGPAGPAVDEILWDTWGVPHVYGTTDEAVFRGQGWAQMESHGDLILRLYGQARGRAAEYWGPQYLDSDRWVRSMGIPQRGEAWTAALSPASRAPSRSSTEQWSRLLPARSNSAVGWCLAHVM